MGRLGFRLLMGPEHLQGPWFKHENGTSLNFSDQASIQQSVSHSGLLFTSSVLPSWIPLMPSMNQEEQCHPPSRHMPFYILIIRMSVHSIEVWYLPILPLSADIIFTLILLFLAGISETTFKEFNFANHQHSLYFIYDFFIFGGEFPTQFSGQLPGVITHKSVV